MERKTVSGKLCDIPVASPYNDRLRSLRIELGLVPSGSPEHRFLVRQAAEMERRAMHRMKIMQRI